MMKERKKTSESEQNKRESNGNLATTLVSLLLPIFNLSFLLHIGFLYGFDGGDFLCLRSPEPMARDEKAFSETNLRFVCGCVT